MTGGCRATSIVLVTDVPQLKLQKRDLQSGHWLPRSVALYAQMIDGEAAPGAPRTRLVSVEGFMCTKKLQLIS